MVDVYVPPGNFADYSSFIADGNAINAATKTALILALNNFIGLLGSYTASTGGGTPPQGVVVSAAHPDFNQVQPSIRSKLQNEITALTTAITNHA